MRLVRHDDAKRFVTRAGIEVPAVTSAEMRNLDRIAVEGAGPSLLQMMENAGRNLAELSLEFLKSYPRDSTVVVLAGKGGNGGGGICAARHLANHDRKVCLCLTDERNLSPAAATQHEIFLSSDGIEKTYEEIKAIHPALVLDALIGYGLNAVPRGSVAELINWANHCGAPIVSLDVPSGIDATTGTTPGIFIQPMQTMTLALPKTGLTPQNTGGLVLADIGIPRMAFVKLGVNYTPPYGDRFRVELIAQTLGTHR